MDCSPPGSSVHGISQAGILEWLTISFSRGSSWPRDWIYISCIGRKSLPLSYLGSLKYRIATFKTILLLLLLSCFKSCPILCDPIDSSPPGSSVPRILQARIPEWVAISFSNAWKWKVKVKSLSHAQLFETPWTAAHQAPLSMGFSRQEDWSGVPLPSPCSSLVTAN